MKKITDKLEIAHKFYFLFLSIWQKIYPKKLKHPEKSHFTDNMKKKHI